MANALVRGGAHVIATVSGRSTRTARLADRAGIQIVPDLAAVVEQADVLLSIVPPEAAGGVAAELAAAARSSSVEPLIADLNAIAPATARSIEATTAAAGCDFVDGSISGPPPWKPGTTRLYLSGPHAGNVARLPFEGVDRIAVGTVVGRASAVKMSTASIYKGSTALLVQALLAAQTNGVLDHVLADLRAAAPELVTRVERRLAVAATKSERYVGEMHEIAATQSAAGLTPALFEAIAEIYTKLARTPAAMKDPEEITAGESLEQVLDEMRER